MDAKYTKTITVLPSQVDVGGRLGVPATFDLFMDTATEAADALGVGWELLLRRGLFWITVKTRFEFVDRPGLLDAVQVSTWPERPAEKRCNRHYEIRRGDEVLVRGKTEWAIVSMLTRRPQGQIDVIFRASAHEGDELRSSKRRDGRHPRPPRQPPDGGTSVLARLTIWADGSREQAVGNRNDTVTPLRILFALFPIAVHHPEYGLRRALVAQRGGVEHQVVGVGVAPGLVGEEACCSSCSGCPGGVM